MKATANFVIDQQYYESYYDDWLIYRAKYRRFAVPFSMLLIAIGIVFWVLLPRHQILVISYFGPVITVGGVYELFAALSYRRRWVNKRVKLITPNKSVAMQLDVHQVNSQSSEGESTVKIASLKEIVAGRKGVFLVFDTGASVYIPRMSVQPQEVYNSLLSEWLALRTAQNI